jgi:hypothetical protein
MDESSVLKAIHAEDGQLFRGNRIVVEWHGAPTSRGQQQDHPERPPAPATTSTADFPSLNSSGSGGGRAAAANGADPATDGGDPSAGGGATAATAGGGSAAVWPPPNLTRRPSAEAAAGSAWRQPGSAMAAAGPSAWTGGGATGAAVVAAAVANPLPAVALARPPPASPALPDHLALMLDSQSESFGVAPAAVPSDAPLAAVAPTAAAGDGQSPPAASLPAAAPLQPFGLLSGLNDLPLAERAAAATSPPAALTRDSPFGPPVSLAVNGSGGRAGMAGYPGALSHGVIGGGAVGGLTPMQPRRGSSMGGPQSGVPGVRALAKQLSGRLDMLTDLLCCPITQVGGVDCGLGRLVGLFLDSPSWFHTLHTSKNSRPLLTP